MARRGAAHDGIDMLCVTGTAKGYAEQRLPSSWEMAASG